MKERAKTRRGTLKQVLETWFVQKYRLPASHPLFIGRPLTSHLREYYEDKLDMRDDIEHRLKTESGLNHTQRVRMLETLKAIDGLLGSMDAQESKSQDPLASFWEAQIARGEEPDLDLTLEDLKKMGKA